MPWFGPQGDCGCCDTPCKIFYGSLNETYTGTTFEDDWRLFGDIVVPNIDLSTLSNNTIVANTNDATGEAVVVFRFTTSDTFTSTETLRLILGLTDDDNYMFLQLTWSTGSIYGQLGKRDSGTDTLYGSATSTQVTTLNGSWKLCYSGAFFRAAHDGETLYEEEETSPPGGFGTQLGIRASDWSDSAVVPFSVSTFYDDHDEEREGCPKCTPMTTSDLCACPKTDFVSLNMNSGVYVLPFVSDFGTYYCMYEDTFNIGSCTGSGGKTADEMHLRYWSYPVGFFGNMRPRMFVIFRDSATQVVADQATFDYGSPTYCGPSVPFRHSRPTSIKTLCMATHFQETDSFGITNYELTIDNS